MSDNKVDKRQRNILVWVLTWAGLLLAVLYSPFGSPELYGPKRFYIANQGVAFNGSAINYSSKLDNTSKITINNNKKRFSGDGNSGSTENSLLDINNNGGLKRAFTNNNTGFSSSSNNQGYQISNMADHVSANSNTNSGIGGDLYTFSGKNSKNKSNTNLSPGLISLTTDLSLLSTNTTNKQSVGAGTDPTTDPGGDPTGDPIPVGDGWIVLFCLSAMYGIWKFKKTRNLSKL